MTGRARVMERGIENLTCRRFSEPDYLTLADLNLFLVEGKSSVTKVEANTTKAIMLIQGPNYAQGHHDHHCLHRVHSEDPIKFLP